MRYFFHIAYYGQHFSGWQKQPNVKSVQEVIEQTLFKILKNPTPVFGCGRTDAQVNASQFFFHADIDRELDDRFLYILNKALPYSISVFDIIKVDDKAHARFDAVQRKYDYFVHTRKDPFLSKQSSFYQIRQLDFDSMQMAVKLLPQYKDYRAFCTHPDKYEHTICNVMDARLFVNAKADRFRFHIASNRFLGKMIRLTMAKLIMVGKGEMSVDEFESDLVTLKNSKLTLPAHPTGLYLSKVSYPYLNLQPATEIVSVIQGAEWYAV